ncbi:MAG: hypothetical protein DRG82_15570, partial [Deltaproteobacteria bacterium]
PSKEAKFQRFGFRKISELGMKLYTGINQPAILMALDLQHYLLTPNPFSSKLELNTLFYKVNGRLQETIVEKAKHPVSF